MGESSSIQGAPDSCFIVIEANFDDPKDVLLLSVKPGADRSSTITKALGEMKHGETMSFKVRSGRHEVIAWERFLLRGTVMD